MDKILIAIAIICAIDCLTNIVSAIVCDMHSRRAEKFGAEGRKLALESEENAKNLFSKEKFLAELLRSYQAADFTRNLQIETLAELIGKNKFDKALGEKLSNLEKDLDTKFSQEKDTTNNC